jgi:hypothetical protein
MLTKFSVGQVWSYATREGEAQSRITIVRMDEDTDFGNIIHIYISNVEIPNADAPGGKTTFIAHMPYDEQALEESVTELDSETQPLPDFENGYRLWRTAFEAGEAGVFDVPVCQAVDFVQQSIA